MRGDGRIYLRGTTYWCCYYLRGQQFRESTGSADAKEASKFLKARLREVGADVIGARKFTTPKASRLTVHDLLETLKTEYELDGKMNPQTASQIRGADRAFGALPVLAVGRDHINAYKQERLAAGYAKATINRPLEYLSLSLKLAVETGRLSYMPVIKMFSEKGNERKGFVEPEQFAKILAHLPADLRDFAQWGYATGQRKGETAALRWDMVDGDALRIPGTITKNGLARTLPLSAELAQILKRRQAQRAVAINGVTQLRPLLFHRSNGQPVRNFRKAWNSACRKAGCVGTIYHDLRRSAARNLTQAGIPREVAKTVTGHTSDSCWNRYNIVVTSDTRKALEQTEAYRRKVVNMPEPK
jgi:integrase